MAGRCVAVSVALLALMGLSGLSGCDTTTKPASPAELTAAAAAVNAVSGQLLSAPSGTPATARIDAIQAQGFVEEEWRLQGQGKSYSSLHDWAPDGLWTVTPRTAAESYETRLLVRRPQDPARFNGVVVVEWLNTSLGLDLDGVWMVTHEELLREGYAWVGVSAEAASIQALQKGLPGRYTSAQVRTGDLGFDIYTQAAKLVRQAAVGWGQKDGKPVQPAPDIKLIAAGYSKSASYLISYANAFQPLTHAFNGYYLRGATPAAIQVNDYGLNVVLPQWRPDLEVPVMQVQTEGEVKASWPLSATPDAAKVRYWEIAGAVHFDRHMQDQTVAVGGAWGLKAPPCMFPTNTLPAHLVDNAAMDALRQWVATGKAPAKAPRLQRSPRGWLEYDAVGNVKGGIRLPQVSLGLAEYAAYHNLPTTWPSLWTGFYCVAGGATLPLSDEALAARQASPATLNADARRDAESLVRQGYMRAADVDQVIPKAQGDLTLGH
jgi:hypothetical protein